jgi:hypothetical protein
MRKLILWLMTTRLYRWLMAHAIWRIRFSNWYSLMNGKQFNVAYALLRPGDILLSTDKSKLTSFLVKGPWTHAALCVGKWPNHPYEVAEMVHGGFKKSMFFDFCKEADHIAILRCSKWSKDYLQHIVLANVKEFEGKPYDELFQFGVEALYCSELIYQADELHICKVDISDFAGLGKQYVSPLAYYESPTCSIVYETK